MHGETYNIKISTKSNTNDEQFRDFEEWYDYNHQKKEQQRLLLQEIKYNQLLIKSKMKKLLKDGAPFTGDLSETFPNIIINLSVLLEKNLIVISSSSNTTLTMEKEMMKTVKILNQMKTLKIMKEKIFFSRKLNSCLKMDTPMKMLKKYFHLSTEETLKVSIFFTTKFMVKGSIEIQL
jgi:hypothetical protein